MVDRSWHENRAVCFNTQFLYIIYIRFFIFALRLSTAPYKLKTQASPDNKLYRSKSNCSVLQGNQSVINNIRHSFTQPMNAIPN